MKKLIFTVALALPILYFAQEQSKQDEETSKQCELPANFKEAKHPSGLKKFVSIDNDVDTKDIKVIRSQNKFGSGIWGVCVKDRYMKYKRVGSVFMRDGDNPFESIKSR